MIAVALALIKSDRRNGVFAWKTVADTLASSAGFW